MVAMDWQSPGGIKSPTPSMLLESARGSSAQIVKAVLMTTTRAAAPSWKASIEVLLAITPRTARALGSSGFASGM